jgi:hypothetical protein
MAHRRALIAADVSDARLQQGFGDSEDALTMELIPCPKAQGLNFFGK